MEQVAPSGGTDVPRDVDAALVVAFREEWGRVVATLIRVTGDWTIAEECAQEAFAAAARRWPHDGVPDRPGAWLTTTARNRALDRIRRAQVEQRAVREAAMIASHEDDVDELDSSAVDDDRLRLIFTCSHPALGLDVRVALTLRALCGLTVEEIARAFGTTDAAMSKRLVRARAKIKHVGIPYRVPPDHLLGERLEGVLAVLYLLFSEGYVATAGPSLLRGSLSDEAIRLTRLLAQSMPDEPEVLGLLALGLLHDGRRAARVDDRGDIVTLEEQDRSRWDPARIEEGVQVLQTARRLGGSPGPYVLQAAIAACHATATTAGDTDWGQIALLYGELGALSPSPYVELNRVIAVAMDEGPDVALPLLDAIDSSRALGSYHLLPATRADLLRRAGRRTEAADAYRQALELVVNGAERRYLERRLVEVSRPVV